MSFLRKKRENLSEKAFAKGGSAAFILTSTYQLMCAFEAIREFEIEKVKIILAFQEQMKTRNEQMKAEVSKSGYEYETILLDSINLSKFYKSENRQNVEDQYDRIYIGDYYHLQLYIIASKYASYNAMIIFLDDGNSMILLFTNHNRYFSNSKRWIDIYSKYEFYKDWKKGRENIQKELNNRGIIISNCFFTSYADIKNKKYVTYLNSFNYIKKRYEINNHKSDNVYIIGTIIDSYDKEMSSLSKKDIEDLTCEILSEIRKKYKEEKVIYIPHPRDNNEIIKKCCIDNGFEYIRPLTTVETFILERKFRPEAVIGFGSTALGTLRCLFPSTPIYNYIIQRDENDLDEGIIAIYNYYKQNGINNIYVNYAGDSRVYHKIGIIENTIDFFKSYPQTHSDFFAKLLSVFTKI